MWLDELIVCPPLEGCQCLFCYKRECELKLAERLELECYGPARARLLEAEVRLPCV